MDYSQPTHRYTLDSQNIPLDDDYEGTVSAKVDFYEVEDASTAVVYVHGYMDYFFQNHLADFFIDKGISFYAVELRKYGSSIQKHQHKNFCKNIREYYEELTFVLKKAQAKGHESIILHGHSTGGLIATHYLLYAQDKALVSAAVLNSPFFAFNTSETLKNILSLVTPLGKFLPYLPFTRLPSLYTESLHKDYKGRWDFNLTYKPVPSFVSYLGWMHAIENAQKEIHKGSIDKIPALILHSERSYYKSTWSEEAVHADAVLNVKDIAYYAEKIYQDVSVVSVADALHDIVLSADPVIDRYFSEISQWLDQNDLLL